MTSSTVTSADIQEIVTKLSSDKAKAREEGIKLLNTWLEGERSIAFCRYLAEKTAKLKSDEVPHSETWPFLVTLLIQCVKLEISASKKRLPKLNIAKMLRIVIQHAGDAKFSGNYMLLLPVVKMLFNHISDVLKEVPSFQSEYGIILRHLLAIPNFRFYMRKRLYSCLVFLYMEKVESSLSSKYIGALNPKEEVFRSILTLHSLLENPPGDYLDDLRQDIVKCFVGILSHVRDEGKISRKLIECVNTYLLKDGPNLGPKLLEIHESLQKFMFRSWITTHDRGLKDALVFYARIQMNLIRGTTDGSTLIEQLLDVLGKELDQMNILSTSLPWNETTKDDKYGTLTTSQHGVLELSALVFYRACANILKPLSLGKRVKREPVMVQIKEGLTSGKWSWHASFCYLVRSYGTCIKKDILTYWFESICASFERIMSNANIEHVYDGLLWTLRSLQGLSYSFPDLGMDLPPKSSHIVDQFSRGWPIIWSCLMRGLTGICNITSIADAALMVLRNIILNDTKNSFIVPQEFWDLQLFKRAPSMSVLSFIICYFSRRASQGDLRDVLHLRKNLLRAILPLLNWKDSFILDEHLTAMLPSAVYVLCTAHAPICHCGPEATKNWMKAEDQEDERLHEIFECSVEVLANVGDDSGSQLARHLCYQHVRLPRHLKVELREEVENHILEVIKNVEIDNKMHLPDVIFMCALLSNIIYCCYITSLREEDNSTFISELCQNMLKLLNHAVSIIEKVHNDCPRGYMGGTSTPNCMIFVVASFKCFMRSPLFSKWSNNYDIDLVQYGTIVNSSERILKALAKLYEGCSDSGRVVDSHKGIPEFSASASVNDCSFVHDSMNTNQSMIMDMELDVSNDSKDVELITFSGSLSSSKVVSSVTQKINVISIISSFFTVLPYITWDILFDLMANESDPRVMGHLLLYLCQNPFWSSCQKFSDLVTSLIYTVDTQPNIQFQSLNVLAAINSLLRSLLALGSASKVKNAASPNETVSEQSLVSLGNLVNRIAEDKVPDWSDRVKLVDCLCNFVLVNPEIGQFVIEKLLLILRDSDYRVRFCLARKIGVLFQTWDGHHELFQDICANFGVNLVVFMKDKIVRAEEVIASGPQPSPLLETTVITLMHLALQSEKIELEAVFAISAVAAIDTCQRELVGTVLDSLSRGLQYSTRAKYIEELIGSILFCWVACGVSLVALVEIRSLFGFSLEPNTFMQYCSTWLLPALIIQGDTSNLNWVFKVACQPSASLVKDHFVHIFSVCMALHCSKKTGWEKGSAVLGSTILEIAGISEDERDKLIKKHMVAIINHILSLTSFASDPPLPLFSRATIMHAIRTIVDGFLAVEDDTRRSVLIDKINIFRPDRVFTFIVEMHYKTTGSSHYRHRCNRLAAIEVLIDVLGHRAAVPSTCNYLLNLVGQYFDNHSALEQCCLIINKLLKIFQDNPSVHTATIFGEQLQFLIPKLVSYCTHKSNDGLSVNTLSQVLSLLQHLILDSGTSLHEYIKELEPFSESEIFDKIRLYHQELCQEYSPRNHLLSLVKRSHFLPPRLLFWSLKALHMKLFSGDVHLGQKISAHVFDNSDWQSDPEVVDAVWNLVQMCCFNDQNDFVALVSDFISRVGVGDPHSVVFHLPRDRHMHVHGATSADGHMDKGISEEQLISLLKLLKTYLMDDSVRIIDVASQALRGVLSTEKGQRALLALDPSQRSLIEVHSKGVNLDLVQKAIGSLERKFSAEGITIETSSIWSTSNKTFEMWIRPLVYVLISYCDDIVLRLCQDVVFVKAEVAEFLFPIVLVNLSGKKDLDFDFCRLISSQVQENILIESNKLMKSVQVVLDALNELRLCHVVGKATSSSSLSKRENSKLSKTSSYGAKSRSPSMKLMDHPTTLSGGLEISILMWEKVYWLPINYLVVAKAAIKCGSYFTAVMYVEYWCEEHFKCLTLGSPDFSHREILPSHVEILISAVTQINEPDSLYGIVQSHKLTSQIVTFEHEGNWTKALEYYDLLVRSVHILPIDCFSSNASSDKSHQEPVASVSRADDLMQKNPYLGLIRSLQQIGCTHVLDVYCQGLTSQRGWVRQDLEFTELQYEAAWRAGKWDFSLLQSGDSTFISHQHINGNHFNENLHSCLRALLEGEFDDFWTKLKDSKQELLLSIYHASKESTEYIYSTIVKLQIFYHLGMAWDLRWKSSSEQMDSSKIHRCLSEPVVPSMEQLAWLNMDWGGILQQTQLHMNLLEAFIAFRRTLLQILNCKDCVMQHLLESASTLRKGSRFSQAAAALHEFKMLCAGIEEERSSFYWFGRLEEAKLLRAQGQHEMAINLAEYVSKNCLSNEDSSDVFRLVGKWLAESRSSNSRTILEQYLKHAVTLADNHKATDKRSAAKRCQMHFHLAHYADALFRSYEERLDSSEWQAAMRLRKHKTKELEALIRRLKSSSKGVQTDYSIKIQELQKQLAMDKQEAEKLQEDRDKFLSTALDGYTRCLVIGDKYDMRVVFRFVSLWFSLSSREIVVNSMLSAIKEVQSYKFIPLVYQIASRMGGMKDAHGPQSFQFALVSLVKKMAIDHPYHTIFQLLALANGDRVKDKQRSRNAFVVDFDKKIAAENLLKELSSYHRDVIGQMKQMVEIYIKLAELETKREDTSKKVTLPRDIRSVRELELVPVVTSNFPIDPSCQYGKGSFPHFKGLGDSVTVMNGINAPKVIECLGSDGNRYRQLAKSGNDDLRQDAVMEQFFGLVNTFLQNHRNARKRRLRIRTYKVVPFTPSAGVLEWVNGTTPLGEYLIGSARNGGAHGRYGIRDWPFLKCRQHMAMETDKRKAFQEVCENFRPVMHNFFLERFSHPADWFDKRLAYTRSVAASSMVGYIVGLGDRHSMNILIDQTTAEVVHIDLGVAFEQGLMLKTPERVPFRLTRDIIDGMGVTGIEGVFRRCCEETLSVMRTNKEALLTIVEVFIHDPLYKWALSPLKALQRQKETDYELDTTLEDSEEEGYEGNKDAARALMRVKQKLDGYEEGEMRSVHGQVQQLIQDAIDPDRLSHMFPGWGAWM